MKKLHKVLMGITAIVMAFSMTAMTACSGGTEGGNQGGNQGGTEQGGSQGGSQGGTEGGNQGGTEGGNQGGTEGGNQGGTEGGNQGGNQGGTEGGNQGGTEGGNQGGNQGGTEGGTEGGNQGGNEGGNQGGTPATKTDAQKIIEAFQTQSFKAMQFGYATNDTQNTVSYACDEDGKILNGANKEEYNSKSTYTMTQKINFKSFQGDMFESNKSEALDKNGKPIKGSEYESYSYDFLRGEYSFYTTVEKQITDFSKATFQVGVVEMPEQFAAILAMMPEEGVPANLLLPITAILNLADVYDTATFADSKLTINFNKIAYKLYNEVLEVIEDLDDDTTVGDVMAAAPVKNLIQSLTYGLDAKEVYDQIVEMLSGAATAAEGEANQAAMIEAVLAVLPQPEAGESVYDYLIKVLESKKVAEFVFSMIAPQLPSSAIAPISQFKVSEVINMVMGMIGGGSEQLPDGGSEQSPDDGVATLAEAAAPTIDEIKVMVKGMLDSMVTVTEDKFTLIMGEEGRTEVSAFELVIAVGTDYTISSISFSGDIYVESSSIRANNMGWSEDDKEPIIAYEKYENKMNMKLTGSIELAKTDYALTDISKAKTAQTDYVMEDGTYYSYDRILEIWNYSDPESKSNTTVYLGVTMENGQISDLAAYACDGYPEDEDATLTLIEGCEWDGDVLTFAIEGVKGEVTCKIDLRVDEYDGKIYYIEVCAEIIEAEQAEDYSVWGDRCQIYIDSTEKVTESTVEEILAQNK